MLTAFGGILGTERGEESVAFVEDWLRSAAFWASPPYEPFVPLGGLESELFFDDDVSNAALVELRRLVVISGDQRPGDAGLARPLVRRAGSRPSGMPSTRHGSRWRAHHRLAHAAGPRSPADVHHRSPADADSAVRRTPAATIGGRTRVRGGRVAGAAPSRSSLPLRAQLRHEPGRRSPTPCITLGRRTVRVGRGQRVVGRHTAGVLSNARVHRLSGVRRRTAALRRCRRLRRSARCWS